MSKKRSVVRSIWALILAAVLLGGTMESEIVVRADVTPPWKDGEQVKFVNGGGAAGHKAIQDKETGSPSYDAFCMNREYSMDSSDHEVAGGGVMSARKFKNVTNTSEADPTLVLAIMGNKGMPNSDSYPDTYQGANRENDLRGQLKRALYFGYVGKKGDLGLTDNEDWYKATQIAVWQICHWGEKYMVGQAGELQDVAMPTYGSAAVKDAAYKLLIHYVFAMKETAPQQWSYAYPESDIPINLYLAYVGGDGTIGGVKAQNLVFGELSSNVPDVQEPTVATSVSPKTIDPLADRKLTDTVTLTNLQAGVEYTLTGSLMDKDTKAEVQGVKCDALTFTASAEEVAAGTITKNMTFTVDASKLAGKNLVVFEKLTWKEADTAKEVAHNNWDDEKQSVTVNENVRPTVKTSASPKKINAAASQTITDTVTLTNLIEGVEYTIEGTVMDKEADSEVTKCTPMTFTATKEDAEAESVTKEITFTVDASKLAGKELVVFETLSWKDTEAAKDHGTPTHVSHADLNDEAQTVSVKDGKEVLISKQNIYGDEIEGATIQIKQGDEVIEEWVSEAEPHAISLEAGNYVFHEENVPKVEYVDENGETQTVDLYTVVTDVNFTVDADGKVTTETAKQTVDGFGEVEINTASDNQLIVKNLFNPQLPFTPGELVVSKVDLGGNELPGAQIQILDIGGKEVLSWTSTEEAHQIPASELDMGVQYNFHEVAAPSGYAVVTDIPFMINADGMVEILDPLNEAAASENNKLIITDGYEETTGKISTTVSAGGKTATSKKAATLTAAQAAKVTTVTDTIKAESLMPDSSYKVTGELMKVTNGKATSTGVKATRTFKTDENGDGTWKMTFRKVKLAANSTYVVFETAVNTEDENDTYEHADVKDKAQTIVVGKARTTSAKTSASKTRKSTSVKTGDDSNIMLWIALMAAAIAMLAVVMRRRESR